MIKSHTRTSISLHCALYLFLSSAFAQDSRPVARNNPFISPPEPGPQANVDPIMFWANQNWMVGVQQSIDWNGQTNLTNLMVTLQQEGNPDSVQACMILGMSCSLLHHAVDKFMTKLLDCPNASTTNLIYWNGEIGSIDLKNGSIAYLAAWDRDQPHASPFFFSHYINLTESVVVATSSTSKTTSSRSSSTPTNTALVTSSTQFRSSLAPIPSADNANQGSSRSSNALALGAGIASGISGALVLLALVVWLIFWRRAKRNKAQRWSKSCFRLHYQAGTPVVQCDILVKP